MLQLLSAPSFPAAVMLGCLAAWLSLAVTNNIRDPATNRYLLGLMFRMDAIREDPNMGKGIERRASSDPGLPVRVLRAVVILQLLLAVALWIATVFLALACFDVVDIPVATAAANLAIAGFMVLWALFLCGGMWFGYWMKMWQVQQVHLLLFIIAALAFLIVQVD